jgi:hypothetical protein
MLGATLVAAGRLQVVPLPPEFVGPRLSPSRFCHSKSGGSGKQHLKLIGIKSQGNERLQLG